MLYPVEACAAAIEQDLSKSRNGPRRLAHPEAEVIRIRIGLSVGLVPVDCLILHFP